MANEISIVIRAKSMLAHAFNQASGEVSAFSRKVSGAFSSAMAGAGKWIGGFIGVAAIRAATSAILDYADAIKNASDRTGISAEQLQKLNYAGSMVGISADNLEASIGKLADKLSETKPSEAFAAALKKIGVDFYLLKASSPDNQLELVAEGFSRLSRGTEQSAIAMELFGKSGRRLIPLLNDYAAAMDEAQKSNAYLSQQQIDELDRVGDLVTRYTNLAKAKAAAFALSPDAVGGAINVGLGTGVAVTGLTANPAAGAVAGVVAGIADAIGSQTGVTDFTPPEVINDRKVRDRLEAIQQADIAKKEAEASAASASQQKEEDQMRKAAWNKTADGLVDRLKFEQDAKKKDEEKARKANEDFAREKAANDELIKAKQDYAIAIATESGEAARAAKYQKALAAEAKADAVLFKPGTVSGGDPETGSGGIGKLATTKSIVDGERAARQAKRAQERDEAKFRRLYAGAQEKADHGRHLSAKEKWAMEKVNAAMGAAANQPAKTMEQLAADQLSALENIEAKIDKMRGLTDDTEG